jgi:hypothetical protein
MKQKQNSSTTVDGEIRQATLAQNPMLAAGLSKKAKCHNCKFASKQFKVVDRNYVHCQNEELYPVKYFESGKLTAWDTLMSWYDTCNNHELKK